MVEKVRIFGHVSARWTCVDGRRCLRCDVDVSVAVDIEQAGEVENIHPSIQSERNGPRPAAFRNAVVEQLEVHALVLPKRPGEEQAWNSRISLDVVCQEIADLLVAAQPLAASPGPLH